MNKEQNGLPLAPSQGGGCLAEHDRSKRALVSPSQGGGKGEAVGGISLLLPTYNCDCRALVSELWRQCREAGAAFEIIVADDASTDRSFVERNKEILGLEGVEYLLLERDLGRAGIRNYLGRQAKYDRLIFVDGDLTLNNANFVKNYLQAEGDIVEGGLTTGGTEEEWGNNLRFRYEKSHDLLDAKKGLQKDVEGIDNSSNPSAANANKEFSAANFMIRRQLLLDNPFDEAFTGYGYEDVLFGKRLMEHGYRISHMWNPVCQDHFDANDRFLAKTEEALLTLWTFRNDLRGYSRLLELYESLQRWHAEVLLRVAYNIMGKGLKHNLTGNNPSVKAFNIYKLLYYAHLDHQQKH